MTFEIVIKGIGTIIEPMQISITSSGFSFGSKLIEYFGKSNYIEIYLDTAHPKVGFKSAKNNITGFKLQRGTKAGQIANPPTARRLEKGIYDARIKEEFVVITVPRILKKGLESKKL